jgi:PDZ domain-containing protein
VLGLLALLVLAFFVLNAITVPYYGILPGDALSVDGPGGAITVGTAHAGSGRLYLATVLLQSRVSEWDRLTGFLNKDETIVPISALTGGATPAQYNQENVQLMTDSQQYAKVAALRRLGYPVPEVGDGAAIVAVARGTPAQGRLRDGDVITAIDGKQVRLGSDVTSDVRSVHPGDTLQIQVRRPSPSPSGQTVDVVPVTTITCGRACPSNPGRPLVGVEVVTHNQSFTFPPAVHLTIQTSDIGGPSAGLAFTLGAIDALTRHDITGGARVAVTGTIDLDGNVGEVGGVKQKTIAVENSHCRYFIVPRSEAPDARAAAHGRVTIVPVDTLDQALAFLGSIHGDLTGIPTTPLQPAPG